MEEWVVTVLILSVEIFFVLKTLTMDEDERVNGARQSRVNTVNKERTAACKKFALVVNEERKKSRRHRMRLRLKKLQASQEVSEYLSSVSPLDVCVPTITNETCTPVVSPPLPPLVVCEDEWDEVTYPSPTLPTRRRLWWFWR